MKGSRYGTHRVLEPTGALPQTAWRLDNDTSRVFDDEVLLDVDTLNVDSASFRQMEEAGGSADGVARLIGETVAARGKQHNPVTGSGGMLVGRVARIGPDAEAARAAGIRTGDRVATLVSLTLMPLRLDRVRTVHLATHQVDVEGQAIVFASGALARIEPGLPDRVVLAALDVAGAAPQVTRLVRPGDSVLILGCGGKSGLIASLAARRKGAARVIGLEASEAASASARRLGACHELAIADARDAIAASTRALAHLGTGRGFDLTVSCVNVADAEMAAILSTRDGGTIYFFSMATRFTQAALGAEGVSRDVTMIIGNGYCAGHAATTLELLGGEPVLRQIFEERFG